MKLRKDGPPDSWATRFMGHPIRGPPDSWATRFMGHPGFGGPPRFSVGTRCSVIRAWSNPTHDDDEAVVMNGAPRCRGRVLVKGDGEGLALVVGFAGEVEDAEGAVGVFGGDGERGFA